MGCKRLKSAIATYPTLRVLLRSTGTPAENGKGFAQRFTHLIEPETLWNDDFEAFFERRTGALLAMMGKAMERVRL